MERYDFFLTSSLTAVSTIIALLSYLGVYPIIKRKRSWGFIEKRIKILVDKISKSDYTPDVIIAIEGGGVMITNLLMTNWGNALKFEKADFIVQRQYYSGGHEEGWEKNIKDINLSDIKDKNLLLIDSVSNSGDTLIRIRDHIKKSEPKKIKTAALLISEQTSYIPDFYAERVRWIGRMPWAHTEYYDNRYNKIFKKNKICFLK